jgi:hypothetical protein
LSRSPDDGRLAATGDKFLDQLITTKTDYSMTSSASASSLSGITRISSAVRETLADSAVQHRLAEVGQDIAPVEQQTPEGLGHFHKSEIGKWWPIIKAANIKPD